MITPIHHGAGNSSKVLLVSMIALMNGVLQQHGPIERGASAVADESSELERTYAYSILNDEVVFSMIWRR